MHETMWTIKLRGMVDETLAPEWQTITLTVHNDHCRDVSCLHQRFLHLKTMFLIRFLTSESLKTQNNYNLVNQLITKDRK